MKLTDFYHLSALLYNAKGLRQSDSTNPEEMWEVYTPHDYRKLNAITRADFYSMPRLEDIFHVVKNNEVYVNN